MYVYAYIHPCAGYTGVRLVIQPLVNTFFLSTLPLDMGFDDSTVHIS